MYSYSVETTDHASAPSDEYDHQAERQLHEQQLLQFDDSSTNINEQLERQLKDWNEIAHSKLLATREARKRAEVDANLLANRIALLRAEEAKTWKIIEATTQKTEEILKAKQKRAAEAQAKDNYKRLQEEKQEEQRRRNEENRMRNRVAKLDAQAALQASKQASVKERRSELRARESSLERQRVADLQRAQEVPRARLQKSLRVRSESPRPMSASLQLGQRAGSSKKVPVNAEVLAQEEKELLRRMRFSAGASRGRPPQPALGYTPLVQDSNLRPGFLERTRCAALASARSQFEPEVPLTFVDIERT